MASRTPSPSPMRGCSDARRRRGMADEVFPAAARVLRSPARTLTTSARLPDDAGVSRPSGTRQTRPCRPPRRRGGAPQTVVSVDCLCGSSADAGVFHTSASHTCGEARPPHQRGGVPWIKEKAEQIGPSFPPTRGCSARPAPVLEARPVFPADAGVLRPRTARRWPRTGPPRRGGVPAYQAVEQRAVLPSPPMRVCSDEGIPQGVRLVVLPADAGVFRP